MYDLGFLGACLLCGSWSQQSKVLRGEGAAARIPLLPRARGVLVGSWVPPGFQRVRSCSQPPGQGVTGAVVHLETQRLLCALAQQRCRGPEGAGALRPDTAVTAPAPSPSRAAHVKHRKPTTAACAGLSRRRLR